MSFSADFADKILAVFLFLSFLLRIDQYFPVTSILLLLKSKSVEFKTENIYKNLFFSGGVDLIYLFLYSFQFPTWLVAFVCSKGLGLLSTCSLFFFEILLYFFLIFMVSLPSY